MDDLIPTDVNDLLKWLEADDGPAIGREPRPAGPTDLGPAINKMPINFQERKQAFEAKKRAGYQVTVSESLEFMTFAGDDSGYTLNDDGEYGYDEELSEAADAILHDTTGFGNQW